MYRARIYKPQIDLGSNGRATVQQRVLTRSIEPSVDPHRKPARPDEDRREKYQPDEEGRRSDSDVDEISSKQSPVEV